MPFSALQVSIIGAGILLVVAVLIFNWWQLRRARQRLEAPERSSSSHTQGTSVGDATDRVEPTLQAQVQPKADALPADGVAVFRPGAMDEDFIPPPIEVLARSPLEQDHANDAEPLGSTTTLPPDKAFPDAAMLPTNLAALAGPDAEIESIIRIQAVKPVGAGALAAGLHARLGKRVRWFGRGANEARWVPLASDTKGAFSEIAACLLLADRNGAASAAQVETFARVVGEIATQLPAAIQLPDLGNEVQRAETLDRLCADVDVQVGLSVRKSGDTSIAGTRLRGVAEAAGFTLTPAGQFVFHQDDTEVVNFTLENMRSEPFSAETLRLSATDGIVLLLDVPQVPDPPRIFDQMKLVGKRLATTLGGELVDDNRRPLDDASLLAIRRQVEGATLALTRVGIEPGSPRARALFGT